MNAPQLQRRYLLPVYLLVAFYLDGTISHLGEQWLYTPDHTLISRLFMLVLVVTVFMLPEEHQLIWYATGIGFLYDLYYTGMIGMYTFAVPLIIYTIRYLKQYLPDSVFFIGLIDILCLTLLESAIYIMNRLIGYATITPIEFISNVLAPTIALNLVFFIFLYLPLKYLLLKLKSER
ncbi:rod shape-determining protein MreD [Latilactobacillus graminis]|uniref:Rod shape-determining protein MreD n=2 Tax=Latilactobacillus graminis TaxID=60519 RepID=A0AA89I1W0_9LACO|nr:rod shape-determining protein MreD [Latilactobacillus graminis]KRM22284.1 rod shape-determining protein MreD [Latilactobacillus graminis DSM 20719]QFP79540.1 rod shape-determining protein MreD [Latilactobacillus graminis]